MGLYQLPWIACICLCLSWGKSYYLASQFGRHMLLERPFIGLTVNESSLLIIAQEHLKSTRYSVDLNIVYWLNNNGHSLVTLDTWKGRWESPTLSKLYMSDWAMSLTLSGVEWWNREWNAVGVCVSGELHGVQDVEWPSGESNVGTLSGDLYWRRVERYQQKDELIVGICVSGDRE